MDYNNRNGLFQDRKLLYRLGPVLGLAALLFLAPGCAATGSMKSGPTVDETAGQQQAVSRKERPKEQVERLQRRERELEKRIRSLEARLRGQEIALESVERRLEIAQAAREEAIREVVRVRERIQGMASQAEASAMFAEARVILDRMEEEAFNEEAREQLRLAVSYMEEGKTALDSGNSGGAAYLFDLIPALYEGMKKLTPLVVKIKVSVAALRESPSKSAPKVDSLYQGDTATGLDKSGEWIKVQSREGKTGWVMMSQVQ